MKNTSRLGALFLVALVTCPASPLWAQVLNPTEGNAFSLSGSTTTFNDTSTKNLWSSFTAPVTTDATGIRIDASTAETGAVTFDLEVGNANGNGPSGTILDSGTLSSTVVGFNNQVNFSTDLQLNAGTVYYLLAVPSSGVTVSLPEETGFSTGIQPDGYSDSNFRLGTGTTPAPTDSLSYVVMTNATITNGNGGTGALNIGNPYTAISSTNVLTGGSTSAAPAEHFIFQQPSTGNSLSSVTVTLATKAGVTITQPVTFELLNNSNQEIGTASLAASALTSGTTAKYTVNFSGVTLTSGQGYNLVLATTNAATDINWDYDSTDSNAQDEAATYEGTSAYATSYTSLSSSPVAGSQILNEDYAFTFTTTANAAVAYWTGASNGSWATLSNFNTALTGGSAISSAPGSTTDVVFSTSSPTAGNLSTTLDAATAINSLTFNSNSGNVTIASGTGGTASTLTLEGQTTTGNGGVNTAPNGIVLQSGAGTVGISAPVILGAGQTWSNASASLLTVSGGVTGTASLTLQDNSTGGITLSGASVNPAGSITNSGTGTGTTTISSVIGSNVTGVTQNSITSALVLGSGNSYSGGTTVTAGKLLMTNGTSGSATGTGTLSVASSGTISGVGASNSTSFNIAGAVVAGSGSANDTTGQTAITGAAVLHNSTLANATLSFNLDSASRNSTSINVGSTGVDFGQTNFSLTLYGSSLIAANTPYILIVGKNTGNIAGVDGSQYTGFTTAASGADGLAAGQYMILTGATLAFTNDEGYYSSNSFLFLNTVNGADDIEVEVVPEPSIWALTLGGLALLILIQRRRNMLM